MASRLPDDFNFPDWHWLGPRLRRVIESLGGNKAALNNLPFPQYVTMYHAAIADAEEQTKKSQHSHASRTYEFAIVAVRKINLLEVEQYLDLIGSYAESLLKAQKWFDAFKAAAEMIDLKKDCAKSYMLMSKALKGEDNGAMAAVCLMKGMVNCHLTNDDYVDIIVENSQLIGKLKYDLIEGCPPSDQLLELTHYFPPLPQTTATWTRILARLIEQKQFLGMALLTVGFGNIMPPISCLDGACPFDVDCSSGHVEDVYQTLSPKQIKKWGDLLASYIVGHKGGMGKRTTDPLGVHLVKLSLKYKTKLLLKQTLETQACDIIKPDDVDANGDTALHVVVKSPPFTSHHEELVDLLIRHGTLPNVGDRAGKLPHQHVPNVPKHSVIYNKLTKALTRPEEGFKRRIEQLKKEGNQAHRTKNSDKAKWFYQLAISTIEKSPYKMPRDLAILYNNMAAVFASINQNQTACEMATNSVALDPTYHKPYWRLGKSLVEKKQHREACDKFLSGVACLEADDDQKAQFILEVCALLPSLPDKDTEPVVTRLMQPLTSSWPRILETLSKNSSWDTIRCLVLGPPEKLVDKSVVPAGWKFADRFRDGKQQKVGHAMCLKATTPVLHTLVEAVENEQLPGANNWVTDLILALLLQGAQLQSIVNGDEETCYHAAVYLCCLTEKLGLIRYILSEESHVREAKSAINREKRTILHSACLQFSDGRHVVGEQLVRLLLEKGINPAATDVMSKKAVDYVAPRSPISQMLLKPPGPSPKTTEEMKERGNTEFKKGNYKDAIDYYTQAITFMQKKLPPDVLVSKGHEAKKHELAVLFSNRAECHLKLGNTEPAFSDAKESVAYDGHWYRGHVRVGRALLMKNKAQSAVKAFSNAFNALDMDATEMQKKDVLKELVKTITTHLVEQPTRIPNLGYVTADLWAKVAYDFFCAGNVYAESHGSDKRNPDWNAAKYAFQLFGKARMNCNHPPKIEMNLKPLCSWQAAQELMHPIVELILFFLLCGSDHTTLSFYPGDTYLHAVAILTFMNANSSLLDWLMKNRVKPQHEENIQDIDGNTALHIFAMPHPLRIPPPPLPPTLRFDLCKILLDWGVSPLVRNKQGQLPIDCLEKREKAIHDLLEKAMRKAPQPFIPEPKKPKQQSTAATASSATKMENHNQTSSQSQPAKPAPSQTASKASSASATRPETGHQNGDGRRPDTQRLQCNLCQEILSDANEFFSKDEKTKYAYSKLVNLLGYKHQKDSRHEKFVREALELIVKQLGKSLTPEVPEVLLRMSQSHLHQVLEKLASHDKWRQVEVVVDKARANDVPRGVFAKSMSVLALIRDKGLCGAEVQRLQILNMLMSHGAQLQSTQAKDCMEAAIQHGEFRIIERLVELGVEPKFVSLEKGDTPLHAALAVALDKDKGNNFSLFELLISMFEKDPDKYTYLNLNSVDKNGNTLLHLASQTNYSKHSHKAVELLMSKDVPVDVKNKEGNLAIDYLKSYDRRTQYLRVAGKQSAAATKKKNGAAKSQTASPVPFEAKPDDSGKDGGDNEYSQDAKPKVEKLSMDRQGFKTKDAVGRLSLLVESLSELTPAEAKLAKTSKGKWLEMEKPLRKESVGYSEEEEEEGEATAAVTLTESGDAQEVDVEDAEEEEEEEEEGAEEEEEKLDDSKEADLLTFDNLEWEVECTAEVWKTLRDQRVTYDLKQRIVRCIKFLASGEWRPQLCRKVRRVPDTINLHQAKFIKGGRILWELAIAFSPRLSEAAEKRIDEDERKGEFAVRGGRMYTEIIRVWDIVLQYDKLRPAIKRIVQSHERGEHCLIRKELKGVKSQQFQGGLNKRYPMLYSEADMSEEVRSALQTQEEGKMRLYPPASASEMEFHILKFYCFSSALVYNVLKNLEMKIDFPFRVTDREHAVINLQSYAPILLLGRSGTGKTTCCLYRLWSRFLVYWTKAKEMEYAAWLPRIVQYAVEDAPDTKDEEDPNSDLFEGLLDEDAHEDDVKGATAAPSNQTSKADKETSAKKSSGEKSNPSVAKEEEVGEEEEDEDEEEDFEAGASGVQYDHLHQLFVTKNQVLCSEVQKNFRELCHADEVAQHHVETEEVALPHKLQDVDEYKFPLFLTSRQLILILDASLPPPHFFERNDDGSLRVTIQGWGADEEIFAFVPLEDDSDEEGEGIYLDEDEEGEGGAAEDQAQAEHRPKKKDNRREVTYEVFAHEIWPKITKKSHVSYHPSLVWTEIMSFIKGSFAALTQRKGYLDKESYEQLGRKQAPNFTGSRDKVYELFLRYADYKRQHGMYDEADLVFNIYQRLKIAGPLPWVLHEVFVDETQDFTQAELTVLIRLAHNPNDMFLTGDTAQSIMRGVSFRFSDLKTLFHYAKQSLKARGKTGMLEVPRQVYQLTHNYRSHAGILSLASAVIDLLVEFFPESFDRLEKDQGLFDGPQPVVLESGSPADLAILLSGNKRKTSHIEFGAHQVILVASEEARNNLPEELSLGLVLTIYEAKGLEFDDVLLYNFFKDSQASKEWRVVTEFLERLSKNEAGSYTSSSGLVEIDEEVLRQMGRPRPLTFDTNLHKILNSELKHLYTAVTRARVNVWIFDQDADKRAPMFEYFKARKLVKFVSMRDGGSEEGISQSMFAEKSSAEEWEKRGDEIMLRSLYDVAAKCYAMAGATHKQNIAIAHQRALKASHLRAQPRQMRDAFLKAAILFLECHNELSPSSPTLALRFNLVMKAGRCMQNARENYMAAKVFNKNGQPEVAGPLYLRARKWLESSQCFEQVDNFSRALKILDEQEMHDQAIDCLQRYKIRKQDFERKGLPVPKALLDHKPEAAFTVASLSYKAAKFYHRYGETQKMLAAIERLPNKEDQIKFLQNHGFLTDAAKLMCDDGRIPEAARMMLHNGQVDKAIMIAEEGTDNSLKAQCYWLKAQQLKAKPTKPKKNANKAEASQTKGGDGEADRVKQLCEITEQSEEDVSAALLEAGGDTGKALDLLMGKKQGDKKNPKKSPPVKKEKKVNEAPSSDEEDNDSADDETQKQKVEYLEKARQQYDLCNDFSGMGECQLVLSKLRGSKELLEASYTNFSKAQPVPNTAGMLECVEVLHKITETLSGQSCRRLIWGVERVFDAVRVLLRPATVEDKNKYQVYLAFYGLESLGEGKLVLHPRLKPRCLRMIGSKNLFTTKEEKKAERVFRPAAETCNQLAGFLIQRTKDWCKEVEYHLQNHLTKVIQCSSFQEGHDCEDVDFCPYQHQIYTQELSDYALNVLSYRVRLDHALQSGAESLRKVDVALSELTMSLVEQDEMWNSVETLLEFIFPAGLLTYNMSSVLSFCVGVARKYPENKGVHDQVQRYLQYLWDNPGRVGKGKSSNVLKERCKSTNWIVMASLLAPLFKLDVQVEKMCKDLEVQLAQKMPDWVGKRHKYALLKEGRMVMTLARRHLDALEFLQPGKFDPFEALIKFTKFVKLLQDRREVSLMPDLRIFVFWLEIFVTLSLCLAAKTRGNGHLLLPACYSRVLKLFNLTLPHASKGDLMQLLEDYKLTRFQNLKLLHDRIEILMFILCGGRSSFCLLSHLVQMKKRKSNTYLLTERTLVLALTLLVNIEQNNVADRCEAPILKCIHRIQENQMLDMPPRLATLIDKVQAAASYQHVMEALGATLGDMNERMQFYQWRWNRRERDALTPVAMSSVRSGGPFRVFQPDMGDLVGFEGAVNTEMDQIDEDAVERLEEEEEEISPEEKARYTQEVAEAQKEVEQKKAASVLQRFFRWLLFQKRLKQLRVNCIRKIEHELFSPFMTTEKMCGVCGVRFEKTAEVPKAAVASAEESEADQEEDSEEDEAAVIAKFKEEHKNLEEHRQMVEHFRTFREMYRSVIAMPLMEIGAFLSKYQVKKQRDVWYKGLQFQVNGILQKIESLQHQLNLVVQHRRWMERGGLILQRHDMAKFFQEHVRGPITQCFQQQKELQNRTAAAKEAERLHQEKMTEGMVEDPSLNDILDVVDRPVQAGPNANAPGRGGGGMAGARRGRGLGRGRVLRGARGQGHRGRGHVEAQFEHGDLPPRFRRGHQN